mgnify:CR=1 FL=1
MANYECVSRTNYFHVKDAELFREFMDTVIADDLHLWDEKDNNINNVFAFGCEGTIYGIPDENGDSSLDLFFEELQKHIADNDAVILTEAEHEKLRYVTGYATVITNANLQTIGIETFALAKAKEMLENPGFETKTDY